MARKKRDYKAEYAAAKRRATAAGYKSQREYKAARKALSVPRGASPVPKRIAENVIDGGVSSATNRSSRMRQLRKESRIWSDRHSRVPRSRYSPRMSDDVVERYHRAFVDDIPEVSRRKRPKERKRRIRDYLLDTDQITEDEWKQAYGPIAD